MPGARVTEDADLAAVVAALAEQVALLRAELGDPPVAGEPPPEVACALGSPARQRVPVEAGGQHYTAVIGAGAPADPAAWWRRLLRFTGGSSAQMPDRLDWLARDDGVTWTRRMAG